MKLLVALLAVLLHCLAQAAGIDNPLIGTWKLDREATAAYLREHRVMPEATIQKLFSGQHALSWRFDEARMYGVGKDNPTSMPYSIAARTGNRIMIRLRDEEMGTTVSSILILDPDGQGYWQESTRIKGYRERVLRVK
jgi:hypothetical protein